jgi:hypothetical protein
VVGTNDIEVHHDSGGGLAKVDPSLRPFLPHIDVIEIEGGIIILVNNFT